MYRQVQRVCKTNENKKRIEKMMKLEVIVQNGQDAMEAEKYGADRLELVSAMQEGGLTPSYGTIKQVLENTSIPVFTMIRPYSHHYFYEKNDLEIIQEDVKKVLELGGTNIVFGALNKDYTVDEQVLESIISISPKLEITFHRAFDETRSVLETYETLTKYSDQVKWILTSGGAPSCQEGKQALKQLVEASREVDGPQILPGAGLSLENIQDIHHVVRADQYHFGTAARVNHTFAKSIDEKVIQQLKGITTQ